MGRDELKQLAVEIYESSCGDKTMYSSPRAAFRAAQLVGETLNERMEAYCCNFCGGFHIGHVLKMAGV